MYNPKEAIEAGFLDKVVPDTHLIPTAVKIAEMFSKLNLKAHAGTKLKSRKPYLEKLEAAIQLDLEAEISFDA